MKCPFCGCQQFYVKNPDDEYETYGFDCESGDVCFDADIDDADIPNLANDCRIFCDKCAWNGNFEELKK